MTILTTAIAVGSIAFSAGMILGHRMLARSLTLGAADPDRTPHKLGDGFYYVVPEDKYVRVWCERNVRLATQDEED